MPRLILIRHGQTDWNIEKRVQGGGEMNALGRAQAAALAERLRAESVAAVYSSPALRARQTARILAQPHILTVRQRSDLRDIDYGSYGGKYTADVQRQDPDLWKQWVEARHTVQFPDGEGLPDMRRRMERFLSSIAENDSAETLLAITHDSPIRAAVSIALGVDDSHHHQFVVQVASMTVLEVTQAGCQLLGFNDTDHLKDVDADP